MDEKALPELYMVLYLNSRGEHEYHISVPLDEETRTIQRIARNNMKLTSRAVDPHFPTWVQLVYEEVKCSPTTSPSSSASTASDSSPGTSTGE